jgi:hypothetical protein
MRHIPRTRLFTTQAAATFEDTAKAEAEVATRASASRRKLIGSISGVLLIGALAAGCGGAGAASDPGTGNGGAALTSAQHDTSPSTTPTTGPSKTSSSTALPSCGSNRDPLDPTGSPPPAGSPALC